MDAKHSSDDLDFACNSASCSGGAIESRPGCSILFRMWPNYSRTSTLTNRTGLTFQEAAASLGFLRERSPRIRWWTGCAELGDLESVATPRLGSLWGRTRAGEG